MQLKQAPTDRHVSILWTSHHASAQPLIPNVFTTVPRKPVIFGNTAGLGPDIDYQDPQMLLNATRMREIHKNWHSLFPREFFARDRYLDSVTDISSFLPIAGRGYITVSENEEFEVLHPPFKMVDVFEEGDHYEGHIIAVYHQLHCLVSIRLAITTTTH